MAFGKSAAEPTASLADRTPPGPQSAPARPVCWSPDAADSVKNCCWVHAGRRSRTKIRFPRDTIPEPQRSIPG